MNTTNFTFAANNLLILLLHFKRRIHAIKAPDQLRHIVLNLLDNSYNVTDNIRFSWYLTILFKLLFLFEI